MRVSALLLVAAASAYSPGARLAARTAAHAHAARSASPSLGVFDDIGKIVSYNVNAAKNMLDQRQARASHILRKSSDAATEEWIMYLKGEIEGGKISFADAASKYSMCPSSAKGGDLGMFGPGTMVPEFEAIVFDETVPLGELRVAKTKFGTHLVTVTERPGAEG